MLRALHRKKNTGGVKIVANTNEKLFTDAINPGTSGYLFKDKERIYLERNPTKAKLV